MWILILKIWAMISIATMLMVFVLKRSINNKFKEMYGHRCKIRPSANDVLKTVLRCMVPITHIMLIIDILINADKIEAQTILMMLFAEAVDNEHN